MPMTGLKPYDFVTALSNKKQTVRLALTMACSGVSHFAVIAFLALLTGVQAVVAVARSRNCF